MGNNPTEPKEQRYAQKEEATHSEQYKTCTIIQTDESPRTNFGKKNKLNFSSPIVASKNIMKTSEAKVKPTVKVHKVEEKENMKPSSLSTEEHLQKQILTIPMSSKQRECRHNFNRIQIDPKQFIVMKTNSILEDYIIDKEIGKGGYGIVYRGTDKVQKEPRAIKKIFKDKMSVDLKLSLINQFQILRQLDHPNVIKLYDIYETEREYYVVTELCEGGDMLQLLNANRLTPEIVREVMTQLFSAIKYIHSFNILHRDLKLENMVIVKKLKKDKLDKINVKLIDFGISLDLNKAPSNKTNQVLGTLVYMAPEALKGELGLHLDLWSCGIICYLLLAKKMPFTFTSEPELEQKIIKGHYNHKPLHGFDPEVKLLISELLQKDVKKRVTVDKALKNVWIRRKTKKQMNQSQFAEIAQNISARDMNNNLVSMIESFLVHKKINQGERQRLAIIFQQIDEDKSGIIDEKEFMNLYFEHSEHYNVEEVKEMLKIVDKNQSGKIDFNEFISVMYSKRKLFQRKNLQEAFDFFNQNRSGQLSREQLRKMLAGIENEELELIFQQLDSNKDDKISKDEFINYLISKDDDSE